jgi:RNA polymerase sigma-70 factor (ECF subfamily)
VIKSRSLGHGADMDSASGQPDPEITGDSPNPLPASAAPRAAPRRFDDLISSQLEFVWRLLRRFGLSAPDADDAAQQVFLVAARRLPQLEHGKERSFLYGTAVRIAANLRRGLRRRREEPEAEPAPSSARATAPDELLERRRARAFLDELLAQLPEELRRVLVLAEIEQLTVAAIAELDAIPPGTAGSRLRRARAAFRELLEANRQRNPFAPSEP